MPKWTPPENIFLQVSDADHETSVTWCSDRIEDSDICYVRSDVAESWLAQARIARDSQERSVDRGEKDFYLGILAALAVVALHDQQSLWEEIVATCDKGKLIAGAVAEDWTEQSGLQRYGLIGGQRGN